MSLTCAEGLALTVGGADYVMSVLPSTEATKGLLGARFFTKCRPGAIVITIGRGDQTNEPDLLTALDSGQLGGAGWHSYVSADLVENTSATWPASRFFTWSTGQRDIDGSKCYRATTRG